MENRLSNICLALIKFILALSLLVYLTVFNTASSISLQGLFIALWLVIAGCITIYELTSHPKIKLLLGILNVGMTFCGSMRLHPVFCFFLPFTLLDLLGYFRVHPISYFATLFVSILYPDYQSLYFLFSIAYICLYFQYYVVIQKYENDLKDLTAKELILKSSIDKQNMRHKSEIEKFALIYKNQRLEEKSRLSQNLHDKIGHSINGAVFQLEACKLLMDKKPEESKRIISEVILSLRNSMDEIRDLLRKEKPDPSEIELVHIQKLCAEFQEKYGIETTFVCEGDPKTVSKNIWSLILDNIIEAFSNSLKYAQCHSIHVGIFVYHKFVRCSIRDDGKGCAHIKEGMGISGMRERVLALGGTLSIKSEPGFEIVTIIPIKNDYNPGKGV